MVSAVLFLCAIALPLLCGLAILRVKPQSKLQSRMASTVVWLAALVVLVCCTAGGEARVSLPLTDSLVFLLQSDGLSWFFAMIAALAYALVTPYATASFAPEASTSRFFCFYLLSFAAAMGAVFAGNFFTLYVFYELMMFFLYPMIVDAETPGAMRAGGRYLAYSLVGSALILIGMAFAPGLGLGGAFSPGGMLAEPTARAQAAFLCTFFGLACKCAVWPLHDWLPAAHASAPAPASALLSGVFTKVGILASIRAVFYLYGESALRGTPAQAVLLCVTLGTVFIGSMQAYKERHLKKRLAYSTVSQASYMLYGIASLTPAGLLGALVHAAFHAAAKGALFLGAGAMIQQTGKTGVDDFPGIGRAMPATMACFTVASLALVGIPPTAGAVSKWYLANGGIESAFAQIGVGGAAVLIVSAALTAGYLLPLCVRAYFPPEGAALQVAADPAPRMLAPMLVLAALCVLLGLLAGPLTREINECIQPLFGQ